MTIDLTYVGATVLAHGREVRLEFRTSADLSSSTIRPLPVIRASRNVTPITLQRSGTTLRTFWSMSAWNRACKTQPNGQHYDQTAPFSLFVYLHVHADDLILRGQALSLSGSVGAFDDPLRNSGIRTAAFSSSTSDGGTLPPFVNGSRVKAGGWFDDSVVTDTTTIYYGKNPPSGVPRTPPFYDSTNDASLDQLKNAIQALNTLGSSTSHRLLLARGLDLTIPFDIAFSRADTGSNPAQCLIGTYEDPVNPSAARPILRLERFGVSNATNPLHLQGLRIINTYAGAPNVTFFNFAGTDRDSCQDCVFERGGNVSVGWVDRCIFTASGTTSTTRGWGPPMSSGEGDRRLVTNSVFAGPGINSHLNYGVGKNYSTGAGTWMEMFDLVSINNALSDLGRARNWSDYRATCRVVADKSGNGYQLGVNGILQEYQDINNVWHYWKYVPAAGTSPPYLDLLAEGLGPNETTGGGYVLITGRDGAGSPNVPQQSIFVPAMTFEGSFGTLPGARLQLAIPIKDNSQNNITTEMSDVKAQYGARPARTRNENHRHLINIRPGALPKVQDVANNFPLATNGHDFDGFWMYDCLGVAPSTAQWGMRSGINPGSRYSADGGPDLIDVRFEHITMARSPFALLDWQTISPDYNSGATYPPVTRLTVNEQRLWLDWSLSDRSTRWTPYPNQTQNDGHFYISLENYRRLYTDRNVYSAYGEDVPAQPWPPFPRGFAVSSVDSNWDGLAFLYQGWINHCNAPDRPDPNSLLVSGPLAFVGASLIYDDSEPPSNPVPLIYTLDTYDSTRAPVPWGETGISGSLTRLYNAVISRPFGQWSEAAGALEISRAVLAAYLPYDHTLLAFPDNIGSTSAPVIIPIGASDYTIPQPGGISASGPEPTTGSVIWTVSWNRPTGRSDVVRYLVALYSGNQGTPLYTREVLSAAATGISTTFGLYAGTYTVTIHASDGMNRTIEPAAYTFTV